MSENAIRDVVASPGRASSRTLRRLLLSPLERIGDTAQGKEPQAVARRGTASYIIGLEKQHP
jgi:hypothetical protein